MISMEEFDRLFSEFRQSAFRLETMNRYDVDIEMPVVEAYLRGENPHPDETPLKDWFDNQAKSVAEGKTWTRVHTIAGEVTPYLKYELGWAYHWTEVCGGDMHILQEADPARHFRDLPYEDFWLFDDKTVVVMYYDDQTRFLGADKITDPVSVDRYRRARDVALQLSTPFSRWRKEHTAELARGREGATKAKRSMSKESAEAKERPKPAVGGIDF